MYNSINLKVKCLNIDDIKKNKKKKYIQLLSFI